MNLIWCYIILDFDDPLSISSDENSDDQEDDLCERSSTRILFKESIGFDRPKGEGGRNTRWLNDNTSEGK